MATVGIIGSKILSEWSNLFLVLSVFGLLILIVWLFFFLKKNRGFWKLKSAEVGTNALISTVAVILILGMINFLAFRYQTRIDFTETKLFTLSSQTQQVISNLPQELKIYVFDSQPNYLDENLLKNYRRNSSNFNFEFIDPQVNLSLTQEFQVQRVGEVHLQYGDKKKLVQILNPNSRLSESQLTNAIVQIQRDKQPIVYILQGHGEPSLQQAEGSFSQGVNALTDKGYLVKPLTLASTPIIPRDANAIIISTPQRELLQGEVETIKQYLNKGGNLLIMLNANVTSGLEPVLKEWGITLDNRLLVDASGTGQILGLGPATTIIIRYGAHPITKDFGEGISLYPLARRIEKEEKDNIEAIALLTTNEQTWAESNLEAESVEFDINNDIPGPIDLGFALTRKNSPTQTNQPEDTTTEESSSLQDNSLSPEEELTPTQEENIENNSTLPTPPEVKKPEEKPSNNQNNSAINPEESKIVIIGNSTFATDGWFQQQLNGDIFLNSLGWLADDENQTLSIRPKEAQNRRLNLTPLDAGIIGWLALLIVPGLGFMAAVATWWQRSR